MDCSEVPARRTALGGQLRQTLEDKSTWHWPARSKVPAPLSARVASSRSMSSLLRVVLSSAPR
eukprot:899637-Rhodomonas_salina.3